MGRALAMIAALLVGGSAAAQTDAARIFKAGNGGAIILSTVAEMMTASEMCTVGDRAEWQKVVTAVDRRYRFCVSKDATWANLMDEFKEAERKATAEGSSRSWGSFAIESFLAARSAEAQTMGRQTYCTRMPWQMFLVPGAATDEAKAEYKKANPQVTLDSALAFFGYIRKLGADIAWVEAPCDKEFWPEFK